MTLFVTGFFRSHSGLLLNEKIECSVLDTGDLHCLASIIYRHAPRWSHAVGVPRGGIALATVLNMRYATSRPQPDAPVLVIDDVFTTGKSLLEAMSTYPNSIGFVIFDRSGKPLPPNVKAIFTMIA
jgi:orotate phosphoribosyltransferase